MLDLPLASSDGRESCLLHAIWKRNVWHLASYFPSEMEFQSHVCWTSQAGESLYSQLVLQAFTAGGLCSLPSPESTHPLAAPRARGPLLREDTGFFFCQFTLLIWTHVQLQHHSFRNANNNRLFLSIPSMFCQEKCAKWTDHWGIPIILSLY